MEKTSTTPKTILNNTNYWLLLREQRHQVLPKRDNSQTSVSYEATFLNMTRDKIHFYVLTELLVLLLEVESRKSWNWNGEPLPALISLYSRFSSFLI